MSEYLLKLVQKELEWQDTSKDSDAYRYTRLRMFLRSLALVPEIPSQPNVS